MSLNSANLYQTMGELDLLKEFERLEEEHQQMVVDIADLMHSSYHRGCRRQWIRCVVRYMYHHKVTYKEAAKVFEDILLDRKGIEEAVACRKLPKRFMVSAEDWPACGWMIWRGGVPCAT